ncbi:MAG: hypothetical protein Hyperionvirus1_185 [Hyperionvirus sp.]|uniref:HNH endonuclease n=1 Tax=Hyperionvirus sp. TaxID=2487770 RepID=A0A3G5A5T6_9VIRU|nr:MAG: hypothetical protein Hyperionvirus1_185 [Hyperionvirus sp.]
MSYEKSEYIKDKIQSYYRNKYKRKQIMSNLSTKRIEERKLGGFNKIYANITNRIYKTFKDNNIKFNHSYNEIIACSRNFLETYLLDKLTEGMDLNNYGLWEIDHIIPVSSFDFKEEINIFKCFNYTNLQPLWKPENRAKFNKIPMEADLSAECSETLEECAF